MVKKEQKKADVSIGFLVTVILLVLGFVILLIFFYNIGGTKSIDTTVCHNSVIFRATLPSLFQGFVPLKCQTNKICITAGGLTNTFDKGNCEAFKGESGITTIKVTSEKQIAQIYTEQIYKCWTMMGEGKVSLWSSFLSQTYGVGSVYPTCTICDRIAFDKEALDKIKVNPANADTREYMLTTKVPQKDITYFEAIVGEGGKFSTAELDNLNGAGNKVSGDLSASLDTTQDKDALTNLNSLLTDIKKDSSSIEKTYDFEREMNFSKDSTAVLFMQITSPQHGETFKNFLGTVGSALGLGFSYNSGSFFSMTKLTRAPAGGITVAGKLYKGGQFLPASAPTRLAIKGGAIRSFAVKSGYVLIAAAVVEGLIQVKVASDRTITAGKCDDVETGTDARNGCSVVRAIPYEPEMISTYCSVIESIP
jgi:hypothetical protein